MNSRGDHLARIVTIDPAMYTLYRPTRAQDVQMPWRLLNDAKHWRDRAEEARATAERMTDPKAERIMLAIAIG